MKYSKKENGLVYIKKCCHTCEFNFGVCAAGGRKYNYGDPIEDQNYVCGNYEISFSDFCKLDDNQQWSHLKYLY
jgi:hypothetical protein